MKTSVCRYFVFIASTLILVFSSVNSIATPTCGNCNLQPDGVTVLDALLAAQISAGLAPIGQTHTFQQCACDVDDSGTVNVLDALSIAQYAAGLSSQLNCPGTCAGSSAGDFWLEGPPSTIYQGQTVDLDMYVNLEGTSVGAYHFDIYHDATRFEIDTTFGSDGVLFLPGTGVPSANPFVPGELQFAGIFLFPPCPTGILSLATIRYRYIGAEPSVSFGTSGFPAPAMIAEFDTHAAVLVDCNIINVGAPTPRFGLSLPVSTP